MKIARWKSNLLYFNIVWICMPGTKLIFISDLCEKPNQTAVLHFCHCLISESFSFLWNLPLEMASHRHKCKLVMCKYQVDVLSITINWFSLFRKCQSHVWLPLKYNLASVLCWNLFSFCIVFFCLLSFTLNTIQGSD